MDMRPALCLKALNFANPGPSAYIELAGAAERCGYDSVWAPEVRATDPFSLLGWVGSRTRRIGLGSAVAQTAARSAVATAVASITLGSLSEGRFRLGLGVSGPQFVEGWHGRPFRRPLSYLRDYLAVIRVALSGEPIEYEGREISLPVAGRSDGVVPAALPTLPCPLPIHLAGLSHGAVALAGEVADGWIAIHCPPSYMASARSWLEEGAARGGRSLQGFTTAVMVLIAVDDDLELARDLVRPSLAVYVGGMGTRKLNFYNVLAAHLGYEETAADIREAYVAGDVERAITAVTDEMVDAMAVCGDENRVTHRLREYRKAGVDILIVGLPLRSHRAQIEQVELIGSLFDL